MNDSLLEDQRSYFLIDQTFYSVMLRFRKLLSFNYYYALIRTVLALFLDYFCLKSPEEDPYRAWLLLVQIQGVAAIFYYLEVYELAYNNALMAELGEWLQHGYPMTETELTNDGRPIPDPQNLRSYVMEGVGEEEQDRSTLALLNVQVQYEINKLNKKVQGLSIIQFSMFQSVQIFGLIIYVTYQPCSAFIVRYFFYSYLLLGLYLHIEIYVILIATVIFVPLLALYYCYQGLIKYYHRIRLQKKLKGRTYLKEQGQECSICMSGLIKGQAVVTLECKHEYHQSCIKMWIRRAANCPNCRFNLASNRLL